MSAAATAVDTRAARGRRWAPYVLLLPSLAFLAVFLALPLIQGLQLALQDDRGSWSLDSIVAMVSDARFAEAVVTTIALTIIVIPIQFATALAMALVVSARLRGSSIWLYVYSLPLAIGELATGIIWYSILTEQGWLNSFLQALGLIKSPVIFLDYRNTLLLIALVAVAEAWRATAIIMIILVSGLQAIPRDYLEAADVLGAGPWQRIRRIILPLIAPSIRVALILRTVFAFQAFAVVVALTGSSLTVLGNQTYRQATFYLQPNVAAAYGALILVLSVFATSVYLWFLPGSVEAK